MAKKDGLVSIGFEYKKELQKMFSDIENTLNGLDGQIDLTSDIEKEKSEIKGIVDDLKKYIDSTFEKFDDVKLDTSQFVKFKSEVTQKFEALNSEINILKQNLQTIGQHTGIELITTQLTTMSNAVKSANSAFKELSINTEKMVPSSKNSNSVSLKTITDRISRIKNESYDTNLNASAAEIEKECNELIQKYYDAANKIDSINDNLLQKTQSGYRQQQIELADAQSSMLDAAKNILYIYESIDDGKINWNNIISEDELNEMSRQCVDDLISLQKNVKKITTDTSQAPKNSSTKVSENGVIKLKISSKELKSELTTVLEDLQAIASKKPIIAPVKLRIDSEYEKTQKTESDPSLTQNQINVARKELENSGGNIYIDNIEKVYDKSLRAAIHNATSVAKDSIKEVTSFFENNPINIHLAVPDDEKVKIGKAILDTDGKTNINIGKEIEDARKQLQQLYSEFNEFCSGNELSSFLGQFTERTEENIDKIKENISSNQSVFSEKDVSTLNEVLSKMEEIKSLLSEIDSKGLKFNGLEDFSKVLSNSLNNLSDLKNIISAIQNVEETIARSNNIFSQTNINSKWEETEAILDRITKKDGDVKKNQLKRINDVVQSYQEYVNMGGTNRLDQLGKTEDTINKLTAAYEELIQKEKEASNISTSTDNFGLKLNNSVDEEALKIGTAFEDASQKAVAALKQIQDALDVLSNQLTTIGQIQLPDPKFFSSLEKFFNSLNNVANTQGQVTTFGDLGDEFNKLATALSNINSLTNVSNILKGLKVTEKQADHLISLAIALDEINKAIANAGTNTNTYFTQLNQLLSQSDALQNLALILQNSTSKIQSVSSGINTGLNGNIPFNTNEWSEATAAASQYLDKLGQIVNVEKNYRELNGKQALSYKVLGSNGNSVTVDQKGNLITAHQKTNISSQKTYFSSLANRISNYNSSALKSQKQDYKDLVETLHTILSEAQKISQVDLLSEDQVDRFIELKNQAVETETKLKNVGKGTSVNSAEKLISKIYNFMGDNGKAVAVFGDELDEIINKIKTLGSEADLSGLEAQFLAIANQSKQMDLTGNKFFQNVKDKISSGLEQSFAQFFSIYDVVNYGKQIISVATDVNSAFTDLSKVSDAAISDLESKLSDYADLAKDVGATITDTISATSDWARMGYNIPDSQELARVSLIYKNVGDGIDIEEANNSLISTLKGFNLEADDAMSIIDKFNEVSNNFAIDSGGIGEALQRSAASFNAANTDLSKSIALITGTNTTLQDPDKVGNMWKTVSARLRGSEVELSEMGEDTDNLITSTSKLQAKVKALTGGFDIMKDQNTYKDIYDIVVGIGEKWQSMTDINRASLLEILAGKNQSNALAAALNNIDVIKKAYETAENSAGSAKKEQDKYEESIQYSIDRIKASCQELAATMADSGMIKGVIDFGNSFVEVLTKIIDKIGISTPLLAGGGIFEFFKNLGKPEIMGFYLLYLHDSEPSRHKKYNIMAL